MRGLKSVASVSSGLIQLSVRASSSASVANVTRPPYYRKPHQHHKPKHMLQEEFPVSSLSNCSISIDLWPFKYRKNSQSNENWSYYLHSMEPFYLRFFSIGKRVRLFFCFLAETLRARSCLCSISLVSNSNNTLCSFIASLGEGAICAQYRCNIQQ